MISGRMRAGVVLVLVVVCSALAGAAIERLVFQRLRPPGPGRGTPEQQAQRRNDMLDRMSKDLGLSAAQRAGIDSIMKNTDSTLRSIRHEMQPRLTAEFEKSRVEIVARLDSAQRVKFEKSLPPRRPRRQP
jgi:hypothetical protein